MTYQAG